MKVESYPRSTVFWYLNGKEIQPSKEFGIDNLEDGTSILTLSEVFPDDAGELMCEAHNDKGVVTTIAHLNVTGQFFRFHSVFFYFSSFFFLTFAYSAGWNQLFDITLINLLVSFDFFICSFK